MAANPSPRRTVLGCDIDNLTLDEMVDRVETFVARGGAYYNVSINVDKIIEVDRDQAMREIVRRSHLNNADGMPVVWAARILGRPLRSRVAGIDLFEALVARAAQRDWKVFLLGAREEVVRRARAVLEARHPELRIVGIRNGYWSADEEPEVVASIAGTSPDLLFVALGSPRKEQFISSHLLDLNVRFSMGVGGSFDVVAGVARRAPRWIQNAGFEWFYRLAQDPVRLAGRYLVKDLRFFRLLGRELVRRSIAATR